ncbi:hypothetical protein [Flavobacterium algoritolerans]|uniref:Uncharacterized protein n=1 Tax=Flavobacterium algoritolerans TaxID=3041254 RepID=A0ABT6VF91_9FLAO|nr:hypothetical protein [Flavobacterium algoritolerans]MDI5895834.1 hypothetical protein [Flavobacterium algoritolerans]
MQNNSFLVAYNKNNQLSYHDLDYDNLNQGGSTCIPLYEDLIFTAVFIAGKRVLYPTTEQETNFFNIFTQQERYLIASEFFDSDLIKNQDYRTQNTAFCPSFLPPPSFDVIITNVDAYGVTFTGGDEVRVYRSFDGVNYQEVGSQGPSDYQRTNYQPNNPDCYFKLSNVTRTLYSPVYHYIPAGGDSL